MCNWHRKYEKSWNNCAKEDHWPYFSNNWNELKYILIRTVQNTAYYLWFWFQGQFEEMKLEDGGELYSHFTCATDTENIRLVFFMVEQRIVKKIMEEFAMNWRWWSTYFFPCALSWCNKHYFSNFNLNSLLYVYSIKYHIYNFSVSVLDWVKYNTRMSRQDWDQLVLAKKNEIIIIIHTKRWRL